MENFPIIVGGKEYVLPPLYLRFMPAVAPQVDRILALSGDFGTVTYMAERADASMAIVSALLAPSFPDRSAEEVREMLEADFYWPERGEFLQQVQAYLFASRVLVPAKAASPGEADAPADPDSGSASTGSGNPSSSPSPTEASAPATPPA